MTLREYLTEKNIMIIDFAKIICYSRQHISGYMSKRYNFSKKSALVIEQATNGLVTKEEILEGNKKL